MTRPQKTIIGILSFIVVVLAIALALYTYQTYRDVAQQPLGPALPFMEKSLPAAWTASPGPPPTAAGIVTYAPISAFPTSTPGPRCGGPALMNILVVGADTRGDNYTYGLGDAIRLVRVDFITPKVSVLEFPRDLWVEIPHIADNLNGQDHEKLNQAFLYGQPGFKYWDDPSEGSGLLALTLNKNFGVNIDHYIAVNMQTFVNIVNAVDGIDVTISTKEIAYTSGLAVGKHHLNGAEALKLARNRQGGSFERADNQNLVLCALRKKLTSPKVVTQIPALIDSFSDNVRTDFTPEQLGQLACLGTQLPPENIELTSFPAELFKQTRVYDPVFEKRIAILDADFSILRDFVARFQNGTWPPPSSDIAPTSTTEDTAISCE